jgi:TPR repeat protein
MNVSDYDRKQTLGWLHFPGADVGDRCSAISAKEVPVKCWKPVAAVIGGALLMVLVAANQQPISPATELAMLQHAADDGEAAAQRQLGIAYREGRLGLEVDRPLGNDWIRRAAKGGDPYASRLELGAMMENFPPPWTAPAIADPGEHSATRLLEKARQGDATAQYQLGKLYHDGTRDMHADPEQARIWLEQAARAGNTLAMTTLADAYLHGRLGLSPNPDAAKAWGKRAQLTINDHANR